MTFSEAVNTCLRQKYATFSGRAPRSEYWWFFVFYMLVLLVPMILLMLVGGGLAFVDPTGGSIGDGIGIIGGILALIIGIVMLAMIIPSIAVVVRRFHDRNLSGWWYLGAIVASMIPFVGILISIGILVLLCLKGTDGPNNFGPDPLKGGDADIFS